MRREEKNAIIDSLAEKLKEYSHFYLTDTAQLNAADTSDLRRKCFENDIKLIVVKNTLLKRALEMSEGKFEELYPVLKGTTSIMFAQTGNGPAKLIKEFRKRHDKPVLKRRIRSGICFHRRVDARHTCLRENKTGTDRRYNSPPSVTSQECYVGFTIGRK